MRLRARESSEDRAGICLESVEKSKPPPMNPVSDLSGIGMQVANIDVFYSPSPPAFATETAKSELAEPYMGALQMNGKETWGNQSRISLVVGDMIGNSI